MQTISPAELYDERYCYLSAREPGYLTYLRDSAERLVEERRLDGNSSVIEAGSNDGSMLRFFQARGVPTLGIEPAPAPAGESRRPGAPREPHRRSTGHRSARPAPAHRRCLPS
jgi:hypothetical protein